MIYLDNNSTTRPAPEAVAAMTDMLVEHWHNPSSVHRAGQAARQRVELARQAVADLIGAKARSITFTSGGTEAIDLAIRGTLEATRRKVVVTSAVEHAAVRDLLEWVQKRDDVEVRLAELDERGAVRTESLAALLDNRVAIVSVQWANNETGVIQPVQEIARLCRERGVTFHCDATQWVGKMVARVSDGATERRSDGGDPGQMPLDVDLLTFSPHKWHGPKGVGVLYARQGARLAPQLHGSQEKGRRGGTENTPGIVGAGAAARVAMDWLENGAERLRLAALRDAFEKDVLERVPDARINGVSTVVGGWGAPRRGADQGRLWNTTNIAFPRLEAEALLLLLSERGVCASAGAACSSGSLDPSPVLLAMGIPPELAHGSLRFSLSKETTEQELAEAAKVIGECVARLRKSMV